MKVTHLLMSLMVIVFATVLLSGCGGDNKVGGLSLTVSTDDPAGDSFVVNAGATYTHPTVSDLVNVPITFNTSPAGIVTGFPQVINTDTAGHAGVALMFTQGPTPVTLAITATTGDLQDTKVVTIPAINTLIASPSSVDLTLTASQDVIISGGTGSALSAVSSVPASISAAVTGTTVTITKLPAATVGTATVTVTDSGSSTSVAIPVTF